MSSHPSYFGVSVYDKSLIGSLVAALAIAPAVAQAEIIFGLTNNNRMFRFDSALPGSITSLNGGNPINGLPPNEHLLAIDIRPVATNSPSAASNGVLYTLGESGQLYTINTVTGTATAVPAFPSPIAGNGVWHRFQSRPRPFANRQRRRRKPPPRSKHRWSRRRGYSPGLRRGRSKRRREPQRRRRGLYEQFRRRHRRRSTDQFRAHGAVRQGGINGVPSPNTGQLSTIGPLGFDTTNEVGFDISGQSGIAYASLTPVVSPRHVASRFFTIDVATGQATQVGFIGAAGGPAAFITRDIAVPVGTPVPEPQLWAIAVLGMISAVWFVKHHRQWP